MVTQYSRGHKKAFAAHMTDILATNTLMCDPYTVAGQCIPEGCNHEHNKSIAALKIFGSSQPLISPTLIKTIHAQHIPIGNTILDSSQVRYLLCKPIPVTSRTPQNCPVATISGKDYIRFSADLHMFSSTVVV